MVKWEARIGGGPNGSRFWVKQMPNMHADIPIRPTPGTRSLYAPNWKLDKLTFRGYRLGKAHSVWNFTSDDRAPRAKCGDVNINFVSCDGWRDPFVLTFLLQGGKRSTNEPVKYSAFASGGYRSC